MSNGRHLSNALSCAFKGHSRDVSLSGPLHLKKTVCIFWNDGFLNSAGIGLTWNTISVLPSSSPHLLIFQLLLNSFFPSLSLLHLISFFLFSFFLYLKHFVLHLHFLPAIAIIPSFSSSFISSVSWPKLYFQATKELHEYDAYRLKGRSRHCKCCCSHSGDSEDYCHLSCDAV